MTGRDPRVFLTGFPGFLGSALIERLIARGEGPIACLVQPAYIDVARRRADEIEARVAGDRFDNGSDEGSAGSGTENGSVGDEAEDDSAAGDVARDGSVGDEARDGSVGDEARDGSVDSDEPAAESTPMIQLYPGDITEPDLGLGADRDDLVGVGSVYHLAAIYDLGVERRPAEAVNVRGTEHVLDAAESWGASRFHHVSTCYVSGRYDGVFTEADFAVGQRFNNHYEATKFHAERAVRERTGSDLRATIYRPSIVVGDSRTGETDKFDGPYYLLGLLRAQPSWLTVAVSLPGSADAELNVVPRDYVVDAIAELSRREETAGGVYHLCDQSPLPVDRFVEELAAALGHRTARVTVPRSLARWGLSLLERLGVPIEPEAVAYLDHPTRYAAPATRRALSTSEVGVPPVESYLDRLVAYAEANPTVGDEPMV